MSTATAPLLDVYLPVELTNGNDGRGSKWFNSNKVRRDMETLLVALGLRRRPFEEPVSVSVIRIVGPGQRLWDHSSTGRGNWKEIEDAMVACGWFHDDGPKWIKGVSFFQNDQDRKNGPAVRVIVRSA